MRSGQSQEANTVRLTLAPDQVRMVVGALHEVCECDELGGPEFDTRIGASREDARAVRARIGPVTELNGVELMLVNNALNEVCNGLGIDDAAFLARIGGERRDARRVLERVDENYGLLRRVGAEHVTEGFSQGRPLGDDSFHLRSSSTGGLGWPPVSTIASVAPAALAAVVAGLIGSDDLGLVAAMMAVLGLLFDRLYRGRVQTAKARREAEDRAVDALRSAGDSYFGMLK